MQYYNLYMLIIYNSLYGSQPGCNQRCIQKKLIDLNTFITKTERINCLQEAKKAKCNIAKEYRRKELQK